MKRFPGAVGFVLALWFSLGSAADSLDSAISGSHRSEKNRTRDVHRHPQETLEFFGLSPDLTVVELWSGGGWYTEILGPYLREDGQLIVANFGPEAKREYQRRADSALREKVAAAPEVYGAVEFTVLDPPEKTRLATDGSVDLVVTFRNTHNWVSADVEGGVYTAAFRALKPGGVFGVVQHRGKKGSDAKQSAKRGYVPEAHVIATAEAAGFKFDGRSEVNANPRDTREHPDGVWNLPPVLMGGEEDRERYLEIGESDRMTLRFVKPG
ncbi:methyltransferase [Myxococcota bacterium]|nr:methyltransferase [Myxococcota bacterium]